MPKEKKICVVGAGKWGKNHIRTLNALSALGGVVESNEDIHPVLKQEFAGITVFRRIQDAMQQGFDGYVVATPAEMHFEIGRFLLENGQHVLIEKPLALNSEHAKMLVDLSRENSVRLMVGHVLLFHPATQKMKEMIDSGKIGRLEYIYSNRLNLGTVRTEENVFWSFAPHDISIFEYFIGAAPTAIQSFGGAFLQPEIHDTTMTTLSYPGNIKAHAFQSWLHPFKEHRIVVIGTKGMLSFEDSSESKDILYYEKGIDWVQGEPVKHDGPTEVIPYDRTMPLTNELAYFIENLDKEITIADGENGYRVVQVLETATRALLGEFERPAVAPAQGTSAGCFVHESSYIDDNVEIGEETRIWHFSHIQSGTRIGRKCNIGQNVNIGSNVIIGNQVKIQNNVSVYEGVELEDYVFCGPSMVFTNIMNPRSKYPQRGSDFYKKTRVREGASIGANATIVCGHTIGRYAFIGAGSVVTRDVPDFALVTGVPARISGWISERGAPLVFSAGSDGMQYAVCAQSGDRYCKNGNSVEKIS